MLSSVLRSERAVQVNIAIVRAFVKLRQMPSTHTECPGLGCQYGARRLSSKVPWRSLSWRSTSDRCRHRHLCFSEKRGDDASSFPIS